MNVTSESIFTTLAEPRRRQIVELLAGEGRMNATDISRRFDVTPAAISQHLKVLRQAGILQMNKQAQQRLYQVNPETFDVLDAWCNRLRQIWSARFDRLEALLKQRQPDQSNPRTKT